MVIWNEQDSQVEFDICSLSRLSLNFADICPCMVFDNRLYLLNGLFCKSIQNLLKLQTLSVNPLSFQKDHLKNCWLLVLKIVFTFDKLLSFFDLSLGQGMTSRLTSLLPCNGNVLKKVSMLCIWTPNPGPLNSHWLWFYFLWS